MKKLKLSSLQISAKELLTREQMKSVFGGSGDGGSGGSGEPGTPGGNNGNPCPNNCTQYCHRMDGDLTGTTGTCPSGSGGTSCHNYCCEGSNPNNYYWC